MGSAADSFDNYGITLQTLRYENASSAKPQFQIREHDNSAAGSVLMQADDTRIYLNRYTEINGRLDVDEERLVRRVADLINIKDIEVLKLKDSTKTNTL